MRTVVPFSAADPKTRLSDVLDPDERRSFAAAMLRDVLDALRGAGRDPTVLATADVEVDAPVAVDDRSLDRAVNDRLAAAADDGEGLAVVMADLPLATPGALERLFAPAADVVLAPGRGGGTNAVVARHPEFRVDYHGASIADHRRIAREVGADIVEVDSYRLSTDVDEPADLAEVLFHGEGRAANWLRSAGFDVRVADGRVTADRADD